MKKHEESVKEYDKRVLGELKYVLLLLGFIAFQYWATFQILGVNGV